MTKSYISRYGKIVKKCPGITEYWYRGQLIAKGSAISCPNPDVPPTKADWAFCVSLRTK